MNEVTLHGSVLRAGPRRNTGTQRMLGNPAEERKVEEACSSEHCEQGGVWSVCSGSNQESRLLQSVLSLSSC